MCMYKFLIQNYLFQTYASKAIPVCVVSRDINVERATMMLATMSSYT